MKSQKIIVVEDDPKSAHALCRLLELNGVKVWWFGSAEEAMNFVEGSIEPDAAILDLRLPGRWGDSLGKAVQEHFPRTRIVFVTGEMPSSKIFDKIPGCWVLAKPVNPQLLMTVAHVDHQYVK